MYRSEKRESAQTPSEYAKILQRCAAENRRLTHHRTLLRYLFDRVRNAALYAELQRLIAYLRRVRMVAFILRALSLLLTLVETGALVLLSTVLFLILLPIGLVLMLGLLLTALIQSKRTNQRLKKELAGRTVYVFFTAPNEEAHVSSAFLTQNALDCAQRPNCACVWVSPYWISSKGLLKKGFYCTARKDAAHLYLVRRYYFFSLKRNVLKKEKTVYIF